MVRIVILVTKHMEPTKKVNMAHEQKMPSEIRTVDPELVGTKNYLLPRSISCIHRPRLVFIYTYE